jgi:hypothetical protein
MRVANASACGFSGEPAVGGAEEDEEDEVEEEEDEEDEVEEEEDEEEEDEERDDFFTPPFAPFAFFFACLPPPFACLPPPFAACFAASSSISCASVS